MSLDARYMRQALELAEKGAGYASPNPMVGAVIVKDGQVVGQGFHEKFGSAHAEVNAIAAAGAKAHGATLYVTLEPCNHKGKTGPCTQAILSAGITRVVIAMPDPNPDVTGGGADFLRSKGVTVKIGVERPAAERLNEAFIHFIRTQRPFVTAKCAATLDGRLATATGDSKWVTGPAARGVVHELRHRHDAIMVGVDTVLADDPSLTTRREGQPGRDPLRVIIDPKYRLPETAKMLRQSSDAETWVVVDALAESSKKERLLVAGAQLLPLNAHQGQFDMVALMTALGGKGISSVLIEGGGGLLGSAIRDGVVQKIAFFYAPKLLGGDDGVPICRGNGAAVMADAIEVAGLTTRSLGSDILIEGYLNNGHVFNHTN